jgi:hypothetical protein
LQKSRPQVREPITLTLEFIMFEILLQMESLKVREPNTLTLEFIMFKILLLMESLKQSLSGQMITPQTFLQKTHQIHICETLE